MIELKFVNSDARPKEVAVRCDTASIAPIMAWYGAYYAGDRYAVFADGEKLPKDRNGELIASVGTHPEGRDGEAGSVRSMGDAVTAQPADAHPSVTGAAQ